MTSSTEDRIRRGLQGVGSVVETPDEPYGLVHARVERRRRRRHARNGALAGVASLALVAAGVLVTRDDTTSVDAANTPGTQTPAVDPDTSEASATRFPKVSIDLPGLDLTQASVRTQASPSGTAELAHFQVLRPPGDTWSLPLVQVLTGTDDNIGIGRENPDAEPVDVNGVGGYFDIREDITTLGWELPDGTQTFVLARGIEPDAIVDLGRSMQKRADGPGWDAPQAESLGLVQSADGSTRFPEGQLEFHTLQFEGSGGAVELNASTASRTAHESRVVDYLTAGDVEIENTTVLGLPAVIARGPSDVRVLWYDDQRQASSYLIVTGELTNRIGELVDAAVELDEAQWAELIAKSNPSGDGSGEDAAASPTTIAPPSPETITAVEQTISALVPEFSNATEIGASPGAITFRVTNLDNSRSFTLDVYAPDHFVVSEMQQLEQLPDTPSGQAWLGTSDEDLRSVYLLSTSGVGVRVASAARDQSALHSVDELADLADQLATSPAIAELRSDIGE